MQSLLQIIYPSRCITCDELIENAHSLCGACWRETHFIDGTGCDKCGTPLIGQDQNETALCDDCITTARPWARGRAAVAYQGNGRKIVLALKHGERQDLAISAAYWMARAAKPLRRDNQIIVPVPLHWTRLLMRRFNQSALLAKEMAQILGQSYCPDHLVRHRSTKCLDGLNRVERFKMLVDAISIHPKRANEMRGRNILLVDDVLTSGATLAACTEACLAADAENVDIVTLARVAKNA